MSRRIIKLLTSLACLLLLLLPAGAQELLFSSLNNEVQLPSQECYKIIQDKAGYIWFSTDNGLCRYGGSKLLVFNKNNGLPEENVYAMFEDKTGKIWFATSKNRILYYENGHLKEAPFNKAYQDFETGIAQNPTPISMDMSDPENSTITNSYYTVRINQKTNRVTAIERSETNVFYVYEKRAGRPFLTISDTSGDARCWKNIAVLLKSKNQRKKIIINELNGKMVHRLTPTALAGNIDFIGIQNKLISVRPDLSHKIQTFPNRILGLYTDKSNGLWVGVLNNGVYYYPDVNTMQLGHHSLRKYSVTGICEDHEQGIWCTTLEKGIYYSRNKFLLDYTVTEGFDKRIYLLKYLYGNLYVSSSSDKLFVRPPTNGQFSSYSFPLGKETFFTDIESFNNHWVLSSREIMIHTDKQFQSVKLIQFPNEPGAAYQLAKIQDRLYGVTFTTICEIKPQMSVEAVSVFPFKSRSILYTGNEQLLLGGNQGLFNYDLASQKYTKVKGIPEKVTGLLKSRPGRIWIITADDGIYWIDDADVVSANKQLKLKNSTLHHITEDKNGTIWVASNEGLYCFEKEAEEYKSSHYTIHNGLPSNEVYKVAADDELIWFSTFEGLFSLPLKSTSKNTFGPPIHLQRMLINKQVVKQSDTLKLAHDQNNFRLTFDILTFKTGILNKLEYSLDNGRETSLVEVNGNEIFLENLSPGSYKLTVYGVNNDGVRSNEPEVFQITIVSPFWQTWWFISLAALLLAFGIFMVIRLITRNIRKAEEAKTLVNKMMAEYQITALQAQMNPHFIFNAINTIQGYILGKNETEAYSYLTKFSKLMRMVLHNSQTKVLRLERELEVLGIYIELEQLRFDHCFDYELNIAEDIEVTDYNIPGMLLQPYVENAIWHGIVNLQNRRRGKLTISIAEVGEQLIIRITDNGVGREKAKSFRVNTNHKSVGMQLTGERLHVMNQLHGKNATHVIIRDLMDEKGNANGTEVEVRIPTNI